MACEALKKSLLPKANVIRDGVSKQIEAREVTVGDVCHLILGKAVPGDGFVSENQRVQVDLSQLTGESLPVTCTRGMKVQMGGTIKSGESMMVCSAVGKYTEFGKTASLLVAKDDKGHFEELLQQLLWVLVVLGIAVNVVIVTYLEMLDPAPEFLDVLSFAVVLLIASIPIALRVVCVTTLALGCRELSDEGAIVSKINAVEEIASMTLLCSDKTGTLTQNKMEMLDSHPSAWRANGISFNYLLQHAALAAKWWEAPGDALDTLVLHYVCKFSGVQKALGGLPNPTTGLEGFYEFNIDQFQPFDAKKKRTQATIKPKSKGPKGPMKGINTPPDVIYEGGVEYDWVVTKLPMAYCEDPDKPPAPDAKKEEIIKNHSKKVQLKMPDGNTEAVVINYHSLGPHAGKAFRISKGAPHILLAMIEKKERDQITQGFTEAVETLGGKGIRSLAVAISYEDVELSQSEIDERDGKTDSCGTGWTMLGIVAFKDPVRPDTKITVDLCKELGIGVKMITGDQRLIAKETSIELELPDAKRCHDDGSILFIDTLPDGTTIPFPTYEDASVLVKQAEDMVNKPLNELYGATCWNAGGFAQVFPEHKYLIVAALQQRLKANNEPVGMTGDGVNDAPALHRADIGIAVEGATDAARAVADIVLTYPGLSAVVSAVVISRKIFTRMKNFVVYRIACTLQLLIFFLIACLAWDPRTYCATGSQAGFFYLPVSALVTIVILNDGTIISVAFDNVDSSQSPEEWNMLVLWLVASVVGGVALASSLLLLSVGLQCSGNYQTAVSGGDYPDLTAALQSPPYADNTSIPSAANGGCTADGKYCYCVGQFDNFMTASGMDKTFGMDQLTFQQVKTMIYLKIALSDYLSLFNSRCRKWFFTRAPSKHVVGAAIFSTVCSSLLAHFWPFGSDMVGIPMGVVAFVWLYTIFWGGIQDCFKVATYWTLQNWQYIKPQDSIDEASFDRRMEEGRKRSREVADKRKADDLKIIQEILE